MFGGFIFPFGCENFEPSKYFLSSSKRDSGMPCKPLPRCLSKPYIMAGGKDNIRPVKVIIYDASEPLFIFLITYAKIQKIFETCKKSPDYFSIIFNYFQLFCKVNSILSLYQDGIISVNKALHCYSVTAENLPINTQKYSYIYIYKYKTFLRV